MPRFHYEATGADGSPTRGQMEAPDAKQLVDQLESTGLRVQSIFALPDGPSSASEEGLPGSEPAPERGPGPAGRGDRLSADDFHQLAEQVSSLTQSELPLASGLSAFASELPSGRLRRRLRVMVHQLERGGSLEDVLRSHHAPEDLVAIVRAGVRTGRTADMLEQYVDQARHAVDLRQRSALVLAYPLVLLMLAILLFISFLVFVVPAFKDIYMDFEVVLPTMTMSLIRLSDFLTACWGWLLLVAFGVAATLWYGVRADRPMVRRLLYQLPLIGRTLRYSAMARFSHLLALMVDEGIPLPEALRLAGSGVGDAHLRDASIFLADRVAHGSSLAQSSLHLARFPATFLQAFCAEKQADSIPELLRAMGDMYDKQVRDQAAINAAICEPIIICLTAGLLGYLVIGLFSPLLMLLSNLSGS